MWSNRAAWHIKFPAKWSWDQVTLLRALERKCIVGKPEDQLFFLNHKAYDDLWLRTSAFSTGRPPSSNHLFKDMGKWDQRGMGEFPAMIHRTVIDDMRIPANFFLVKFVRYLPCHGRDFRKFPSDVRRFPTIFRRLSECGRKRPKMFRRTLTTSEAI